MDIAEHEISIFVFRPSVAGWEYLVVRRSPAEEFFWSPIHTTLRPEETLRRAAVRRMQSRWQAPRPKPWVDLNLCEHLLVGDLDLVSWSVGYGVGGHWQVADHAAHERADAQWVVLPRAFELLQSEKMRRALFRLHLALSA